MPEKADGKRRRRSRREVVKREKREETQNVPQSQPSLRQDILFLLLKIGIICLIIIVLFTFIYGVFRCEESGMSPAVKDGDLIVYYRLDKNYVPSDVAVVEYEGRLSPRRVIATEGDTVDITEDGLTVNGALQQESEIYEETLLYEDGIDFPLILEQGEIFLLGDAREHAADSRIYGPVKAEETYGKVMMVIRRRGI